MATEFFTRCSPMGDSDKGIVGVFVRVFSVQTNNVSRWGVEEVSRQRHEFVAMRNQQEGKGNG